MSSSRTSNCDNKKYRKDNRKTHSLQLIQWVNMSHSHSFGKVQAPHNFSSECKNIWCNTTMYWQRNLSISCFQRDWIWKDNAGSEFFWVFLVVVVVKVHTKKLLRASITHKRWSIWYLYKPFRTVVKPSVSCSNGSDFDLYQSLSAVVATCD